MRSSIEKTEEQSREARGAGGAARSLRLGRRLVGTIELFAAATVLSWGGTFAYVVVRLG